MPVISKYAGNWVYPRARKGKIASCFEGIGVPLRVAGWKCQFSSAARHLSSMSEPRLCSTVFLTISPRSSIVISITSLPGESGNCHGINNRIGRGDRKCRANLVAVQAALIQCAVRKPGLRAVAHGRQSLGFRVVLVLRLNLCRLLSGQLGQLRRNFQRQFLTESLMTVSLACLVR